MGISLILFKQIFENKLLIMNKIDLSDTNKINKLFQQAVDKKIENHRSKGKSIAISDEQEKVKIIPTREIPKFEESK